MVWPKLLKVVGLAVLVNVMLDGISVLLASTFTVAVLLVGIVKLIFDEILYPSVAEISLK